jgi:hypothetical protein
LSTRSSAPGARTRFAYAPPLQWLPHIEHMSLACRVLSCVAECS